MASDRPAVHAGPYGEQYAHLRLAPYRALRAVRIVGVGGHDLVEAYPPPSKGRPHRAAPRFNPYRLVDVGEVALDGRLRDVQLCSHLAVGEAAKDEGEAERTFEWISSARFG